MRLIRLLVCSSLAPALAVCIAAEKLPADQPPANPAEKWAAEGDGGEPSFVKHVVPLFNKVGCSARDCHGSFQGQSGFRLSLFGYDPELDYRELTRDDDDDGPRVDAKHPRKSLLLKKPLDELGHGGGQRFERGSWQHRILKEWIAAGAKYNSEKAPYLERLDVSPREIRFSGDETAQLRTVAHFSDGTREVVTPLTTFSTNNESVAQVSEDGVVSAAGVGDTAIVANYGGGVITAQVLVPRESDQPFPDYPPNNRIDELVAAKLKKLGIHPSGLCSDAAFIRRAYVDTIGTLPPADKVREFLADDRPDKRARLIDELLGRPEYAMYWATIFSDWTGNNRSNINTWFKTVWLWHDWLEDKLARNVPYDELVEGIVTATSREGRPLEEYLEENKRVAANIKKKREWDDGTYASRKTLDLYWMKRMPDPKQGIAVLTANTFLGVQIQCAQCHKHPFDRWTQEDFEQFVSFFRTMGITDLDGSKRSGGSLDYDKIAAYPSPRKKYRRQIEKHPPKILGGRVVPYEEDGKDPRKELMAWMRAPENPYFAPNIVNRIWEHYFGVGIVDPIDGFSAANPPSNPQLLDWLAGDFIEHGFDLQHVHRRILNSRTYQLSHRPNGTNRTDRRNFSHALVRRMPAEVAFDAIARVTGTSFDFKSYAVPPGKRAIELAPPMRYGDGEYFMEIFGRPKREQTCACERSNDAALAQALYLLNDTEIHSRIADSDGRLARLVEEIPEDRKLVEELYLTCLSRYPRPEERERILAYLDQAPSRKAASQDVLWSLINVREFVFVR